MKKKVMEKFIMDRAMHFGCIKVSFKIGQVFEIDFNERMMRVDGATYTDIRDAEICIKKGWMKPYTEEAEKKIKVMEVKINKNFEDDFPKKNKQVMKIIHSDADLMEREIKIPETIRQKQQRESNDKSKLNVVREVQGEDIRGLTVLRNSDDADIAAQLNAEHLTPLNTPVKVAKIVKADEAKVKQNLEARKKAIEAVKAAKKNK